MWFAPPASAFRDANRASGVSRVASSIARRLPGGGAMNANGSSEGGSCGGVPQLRRATAWAARSCLDQTPGAHHVVGQGVPQRDDLDLLQTPNGERRQTSIARLSVGTFSCRCALLVNLLGRVFTHALAPLGNTGAIVRLRGMAISVVIARLGHWSEHRHAVLRQRFDVVELDEATVHEMLARTFAILTRQGIVHRRHLAHVRADVVDRDSRDRRALCVGSELDVVGRPEAAVGHLHHPRLCIARGGARFAHARFLGSGLFILFALYRILLRLPGRTLRLAACLLLVSRSQLFGYRQRRTNPLLAILGRPLAGRGLLATGRTWIGVHLRAQINQRFLRIAPAIL